MRRVVLLLASSVLGVLLCAIATGGAPTVAQESGRPNIIFILTDDLDAKSIWGMPYLRHYLINQGTKFENAFVTTSLCCPSRTTTLRGQYSHNHGVLTNQNSPLGGQKRLIELGLEKSTIATWLDEAGYQTVQLGKYLNGYKKPYKPPGWDKFYGPGGYAKSDTYHTDYYAEKASNFIKSTKGENDPFFLWVGTKAPHEPAEPAPRHADAFPDATAPRPPSFNEEDVSDKPLWIRGYPSLTPEEIAQLDEFQRKRLQSMLAVDEMIKRLIESLQYSRKLKNTYIVFTSDNGVPLGTHRKKGGKWSPYEEDIRVPLIVRGPGVPEGKVRQHMVLNNDLGPTFAQLGRASKPSFVDGRSFVPLLRSSPPPPSNWRSAFLVEGERAGTNPSNPAYKAVRTKDRIWVEYATGERELYNLAQDPYELESRHITASEDLKQHLASRLDRLRDCAREACRTAEGF